MTTPNNWENESLDFIGEVYTIKDGRMSEPPNPFVGCRQSGPRWCGYHARRKSRRGRQADLGVPLVIVGAEESLIQKSRSDESPSMWASAAQIRAVARKQRQGYAVYPLGGGGLVGLDPGRFGGEKREQR